MAVRRLARPSDITDDAAYDSENRDMSPISDLRDTELDSFWTMFGLQDDIIVAPKPVLSPVTRFRWLCVSLCGVFAEEVGRSLANTRPTEDDTKIWVKVRPKGRGF